MYYYYCASCLAVVKFPSQALTSQEQQCALRTTSGCGNLVSLHGKLFSYCTKCVKVSKQKQTCSACKTRNIKVVFPDGKGISGSNISKSLKLKSQDLVSLYNAYYETSADTLFLDPATVASAASTYPLSTSATNQQNVGQQADKGGATVTKKKDQQHHTARKNNKTQRFNVQFSTIECVNCTIAWSYNFALQQYINNNGEMYNFHSRKCGHCGNYTKAVCSQCSKSISLSHIFSHYNQHNSSASSTSSATSTPAETNSLASSSSSEAASSSSSGIINIAGATALTSFIIDEELNAMLDSVKQEQNFNQGFSIAAQGVQVKQEQFNDNEQEFNMCDIDDQQIFQQPGTITRSTSNSSSISTMSCTSSNSVLSTSTGIVGLAVAGSVSASSNNDNCYCGNNEASGIAAHVPASAAEACTDELMKDDLLEFCGEQDDDIEHAADGGCCNLIAPKSSAASCCHHHSNIYDVECEDEAANYLQGNVFAIGEAFGQMSANQLDDDQYTGTNQSTSYLVWQQ